MSKRSNVKLEGTLLSTRSTSVFKKVTDEYEYSECGLCFQSKENNSIVENKVAVGTVDETIDVYQKVVKIVELNMMDYINACNDKDDVSLYLTMPNGPFKNK